MNNLGKIWYSLVARVRSARLPKIRLQKRAFWILGVTLLVLLLAGVGFYFKNNGSLGVRVNDRPSTEEFDAAKMLEKPTVTIKSGQVLLVADFEGAKESDTTFYYSWEPKITLTTDREIMGVRVVKPRLIQSPLQGKRTLLLPPHKAWKSVKDGELFPTSTSNFSSLPEGMDSIILPVVSTDTSLFADAIGKKEAIISFKLLTHGSKPVANELSNTLIFQIEVLYGDGSKASKSFAKQVNGTNLTEANKGYRFNKSMAYGLDGQKF